MFIFCLLMTDAGASWSRGCAALSAAERQRERVTALGSACEESCVRPNPGNREEIRNVKTSDSGLW